MLVILSLLLHIELFFRFFFMATLWGLFLFFDLFIVGRG